MFEDIRKKGIGQEDKVVSGTLTNILLDQIQTRHPQTRQQSKYKLVIRYEQLHTPIQDMNNKDLNLTHIKKFDQNCN